MVGRSQATLPFSSLSLSTLSPSPSPSPPPSLIPSPLSLIFRKVQENNDDEINNIFFGGQQHQHPQRAENDEGETGKEKFDFIARDSSCSTWLHTMLDECTLNGSTIEEKGTTTTPNDSSEYSSLSSSSLSTINTFITSLDEIIQQSLYCNSAFQSVCQ